VTLPTRTGPVYAANAGDPIPRLRSGVVTRSRPKAGRMSRPTVLTVDDDPQVSAAITRDLLSRYGSDYRVVRTT